MSDTNLGPGGSPIPPSNAYNPIFTTAMAPGTPVSISTTEADTVQPAKANSATTTYTIGVATSPGGAGVRGDIVYAGPVTLTAAEWALVLAGGGELVQGVPYYVSSTVAGQLTTVAPSAGGTFTAPIGYALSPLSLFVQPSFPVSH